MTATGVLEDVVVPLPSWPAAFEPQHLAAPAVVIAQVWLFPDASRLVTTGDDGTVVVVVLLVVVVDVLVVVIDVLVVVDVEVVLVDVVDVVVSPGTVVVSPGTVVGGAHPASATAAAAVTKRTRITRPTCIPSPSSHG